MIPTPPATIQAAVDATVSPLMAKDHIPGMAVAVTIDGTVHVYNYGVAAESPRVPVTDRTLFEIGSLSKTFAATAAAWAQAQRRLSLADPIATYLPELAGTPFGKVPLVALGTHTPGGLALQVPDTVTDDAQLMRYLQEWRPRYATGTYRTYSNIGIGVLGMVAAKAMGEDFSVLAQQRLFPALGLAHTYIDVPGDESADYAWGYTDKGAPVRMTPGVLWREAYGVRTTASDMIRFIQENIDPSALPGSLAEAITSTHTGYFTAGAMTQDLIWEQYPYPVSSAALLAGNSYAMIFDPTPVRAIVPPKAPDGNAWLNKTGSTRGFGAYAAFVPSKRIGIVLLANTSYPIADRVDAAYGIITKLESKPVTGAAEPSRSGRSRRLRI